jgi:hypothetical protein
MPKALYPHDVLANSELSDKLSGVLQNPQVSRYLGKATKVVVACAISGCILLLIAILAVVNVLTHDYIPNSAVVLKLLDIAIERNWHSGPQCCGFSRFSGS